MRSSMALIASVWASSLAPISFCMASISTEHPQVGGRGGGGLVEGGGDEGEGGDGEPGGGGGDGDGASGGLGEGDGSEPGGGGGDGEGGGGDGEGDSSGDDTVQCPQLSWQATMKGSVWHLLIQS